MGHQQASFPVALSGFAHRLVQRPDLLVQPVQQAQQIRPPMRIPARQRQRLDLAPPPRRPHSGTQQPFVLGHRVQLVLHSRAHPHQAAAVQQQLPQLLVLHPRLPDCRKSILHQ